MLEELPSYLRTEISLYMFHKLVKKIYFFQDKDPGFIAYVIPKLQVLLLQRNDTVFNIYQLAEEVYFLMEGRVAFLAPSGILYRDYGQGTYFGEVEIILGKTRSCTAKVIQNNAHLLVMTKVNFIRMLEDYPNVGNEVVEVAHRRELLHQLDIKRVPFNPPSTLNRTNSLVRQPTITLVSHPMGERSKTELKKQKFRNMWQELIHKSEQDEAAARSQGAIRSVLGMFKQRRRGSHLLTVAAAKAPKVSSSSLKVVKQWLVKREKGPPLQPGSKWKIVQEHFHDLHKVRKKNSLIRISPSAFRRKTIKKVDFLFDPVFDELLPNLTPRQEQHKRVLTWLKQHNMFLHFQVEHVRRQDVRVREWHYRLTRKFRETLGDIEKRLGLEV